MRYQNRIVGHSENHNHSIHSAEQDRSHQESRTATPSATPWFSDDEDLSPRASKYYSDLFELYTQQPVDVASTGKNTTAAHRADVRKVSTVTLFPSSAMQDTGLRRCDYVQRLSRQDKTTSALSHSFFKKHYQKAKAIYQNCPPGEAELFWEGIKSYREAKERDQGAIFDMCIPRRRNVDSEKPHTESNPHNSPSMAPRATEGAEKQTARVDSAVSYGDISRTSREVPIKLRQTVLAVDIDKPLPPSPALHNVPPKRVHKGKGKVLDVNKPLPRTPLPCSDALNAVDDSPVDAPWSFIHSTSRSKPSKEDQARAALKAKISRPILIPSPTYDTDRVSEKAKGKQKVISSSPAWRDKFAHPTLPALALHKKKRPDSDESFGCQGVGEGGEGWRTKESIMVSSDDVREQWADPRRTGRWI
ncbi:hypothetical protein SVAN01_06176 [Stagonosporopsis vannaccii]|nr:hypothetical protein SVAN01_06176 [Stagonosporopsis vannaccii]